MSTGSKVEVPQPGQDTSIDVPQRSPSPRLRNPDHVANTGVDEESTYVLTLRTDRDFHQRINDLRKLYFPPQLNKIGAHITLFHALPGSQLQAITSDLQTAAQIHTPFAIQIHEPLRLSRGVALNAKHKKAEEIFNTLKLKWGPTGANFLSKQDQHFKAHYTIQNKAEKEVAQSTWEEVRDGFKRDEGLAIGLTLYKYLRGGYWKFQRHFDFVESIAPIMSPAQFPLLGTASS